MMSEKNDDERKDNRNADERVETFQVDLQVFSKEWDNFNFFLRAAL